MGLTKLPAHSEDPSVAAPIFSKVWERQKKELKEKRVYPSVGQFDLD